MFQRAIALRAHACSALRLVSLTLLAGFEGMPLPVKLSSIQGSPDWTFTDLRLVNGAIHAAGNWLASQRTVLSTSRTNRSRLRPNVEVLSVVPHQAAAHHAKKSQAFDHRHTPGL